jgi:hypothetical protein
MKRASRPARDILEDADASLLDVVDNVINKGVVVTGEVILGVANVDLVYLRLSALLCAADRLLARRERRRRAVRVRLRPR